MANNKFIQEKRDSLLHFVQEQLIGPGVCLDRFGIEDESITGEVINTSPGSVYCSAILFPEKKDTGNAESEPGDNTSRTETGVEDDSIGADSDNALSTSDQQSENNNDDDSLEESESLQINQRYPQNFGISVCFDKSEINPSDFRLRISGRYYRKLKSQDAGKLYVSVAEDDKEGVAAIAKTDVHQGEFASKMSDYFILKGNKLYLVTTSGNRHNEIKKSLDAIDQIECERFSQHEKLERPIYSEIRGFKYLTTYKERLFERLKKPKTQEADAEQIKAIIEKTEKKEAELSYFRELMAVIDSRDYGFWYAENFCKEVDLSEIDFTLLDQQKKSILYKDAPSISQVVKFEFEENVEENLNEEESKKKRPAVTRQASLSLCFQVTKDTRNKSNDKTYLKIQLVNTSDSFEETQTRLYSIVTDGVNKRSFFGVKVEVESKYLSPYRPADSFEDADDESEKLKYIYRNVKDYGIGHFCSVNWAETRDSVSVWSEFLPEYDIPDVDTAPKFIRNHNGVKAVEDALSDTNALQIHWLSTLYKESKTQDIVKALNSFVDVYKDWIDTLNDSDFPEYAEDIQSGCLSDYKRMKDNIEMLSDECNMLVFRLMNTAMFIQMWHSQKTNRDYLREKRDYLREKFEGTSEAFYSEQSNTGQPVAWRPFQLAFILLNLDGIIQRKDDSDWKARNDLVDLVWFPTGGGKTESYLGIIALAILYRRITNAQKKKSGGGTTAIMRYTLRLLATQQFQRATRLIFALEQIRKWGDYQLGEEEISIGLFVGSGALPNTLSGNNNEPGLKQEASKWQNGQDSKIPLGRCPWCGKELAWDDSHNVFFCTNAHCAFRDRLPVLLCDELIYKTPPTLLFGTVDKFAMIAHNVGKGNDSRKLFKTEEDLTPDLIIQDELHLLQGPLGSAVGLFECAIDYLCKRKALNPAGETIEIRPKVISSTATTRNTSLQIKALYDRQVNIFPKSGINYDDSFFAFYKRRIVDNHEDFISKRKYVGILPTGRTAMFVQVRLAACCFVHRAIFELEHIDRLKDGAFVEAADYYYSLISYFNSLKEVGTTDVQFYTEFTKYARRLFRRVMRPGKMLQCFYSFDGSMHESELTGRLSGPEVVKTLEKVQTSWSPAKRLPYTEDGKRHPILTPPDFILATNMISVGIDVSRFNLMIINSMPRNKAEYIQASSRVARDDSGIVFTLHNPFRVRDLSHFERFREFHEKLYYYVEPISITPFSSKAIERYMPLLLGTITRHTESRLADNQDAKNLKDEQITKVSKTLYDYFSKRLSKNKLETDSQLKEVFTEKSLANIQSFIAEAFSEWKERQPSKYSYDTNSLYVSTDSYDEEKENTHWVVPRSVRTVPAGSVIKVKNEI